VHHAPKLAKFCPPATERIMVLSIVKTIVQVLSSTFVNGQESLGDRQIERISGKYVRSESCRRFVWFHV
jgi:hypothetical protein